MNTVLVLASASPRRFDLLSQLGYQPHRLPVDIDESVALHEQPVEYAKRMAREKLDAAMDQLKGRTEIAGLALSNARLIVLAGDTICIKGSEILTKPVDFPDFQRMMGLMSGSSHTVLSSFALGELSDGVVTRLNLDVVKTDVHFKELSAQELAAYWDTEEPADKAGGYGIQGLGAVFVERIEGSYSNVVGLPLMEVHSALKSAGVA
ncbi:hypothetical protein A3750_20555, partial [Oleiphilus sp. HI0079]|uniref:Maf family protein n=2 Tax=Oleiphilus TaxID=141450 RepID=UPI0007C35453